ncbi:MAG: hypothetical protein ACJATO_002266, partial [Arenicella sp.]
AIGVMSKITKKIIDDSMEVSVFMIFLFYTMILFCHVHIAMLCACRMAWYHASNTKLSFGIARQARQLPSSGSAPISPR